MISVTVPVCHARSKWVTYQPPDQSEIDFDLLKTNKVEDDKTGRRQEWKMTKIEDEKKWKMTKTEDDQNGRRPK